MMAVDPRDPRRMRPADPNLPDTVLLCVVSNLNTRLVVTSSRTGTMGDIRALIKQNHEVLFPDRGEVNVTAMEVTHFGGRSRVADSLPLLALFHNMLQDLIYVELTSPRPNTRPPELPTELVRVPDPDGLLTPSPAATHEQEDDHDTSERGLNQDIGLNNVPAGAPNSRSPVSDCTNSLQLQRSDRNSEVVKRQVTKKKRNVEERGYVNIVCNRQTAEGAVAGTTKSLVDPGHSDREKVHEEPREVTAKRTEEDSVNKNLLVVKSRHKSSNTDGSEKSGHPEKETVQEESATMTSKPSGKDTAPKNVIVVEPRQNSSSADNSSHRESKKVQQGPGMVTLKSTDKVSVSKSPLVVESKRTSGSIDGQLGLSGKEKAREEVGMATSKPGSSNRDGSSRPSEPRTDLQHRRTAPEKETSAVGASMPATTNASDAEQELAVGVERRGSLQNRNKHRKRPETHLCSTTSGSTTCESGGQSVGPREKSMDLQGKHANSNGGEIVHNNPGDGSKPLSPQGTFTEDNCDHEKSENVSPLQSSDESEDDDQGSSSEETDGSEEIRQGVSPRMDFSTPGESAGARSGHSRRSFGHFENLKYQHLLDSQDGFDELISLSQQKLKVVPGHQQDHQQLGGDLLDSVAPVSLEDDSFSIDLVPDTQVGDANKNVGSQGVQNNPTAVDPVEDNINERQPSTVASASAADPQKECMLPTEPVQDGVDNGDKKSKSQPSRLGTTGAGLVESSLTKRTKRRKQGTSRSEGRGLITVQESIVDIAVEKDELLLGDSVFPRSSDAPASANGGRISFLEYRDTFTTHDQTHLATTHKMTEMKKLGLKGQKLLKSSTKGNNQGVICAGKVDPLVTEFDGTQKSQEILSEHEAVKTKTRKGKRRLSDLEFTEKSSTQQSSKKAGDSRRGHKKGDSTVHPGPDKIPLQVPDMEEEGMEGKEGLLHLDAKHRNANVDEGANMKSANVVLDEKKKSRRSGEASKALNKVKNRNGSKLEVAEEVKQFYSPMALDTGHEHSILRNEGETPDKLTLKKKQKKRKEVELKSSPEVGERRGAEVQSIAGAGYVEQEDLATLPQSLDNVRKLTVTDGVGRKLKRPRQRKK